ncbi:AAA family ATPase [Paulownia witches'-broom phytoplasma]|uniref:AAA family ATPase n=2 Tax=Paulownia witches'-broom phytoplasma TaxID=39647 RepID=A0ABX8TPQ0_9MOLU|nr:AAA family ATPase [Paulownia witches'-broom phytoplasma]QYC31299.1 AAA family ATPase [Paulownia witches'-broom phytoplasma]
MKLKKIYLTFLGVCILAVLGLWIYGFLSQTSKQNDLPQNNSLTPQKKQELDEISKYLEELKKTNEAQIKEQRKNLQQIQHLDQQIKLNLDIISDCNIEVQTLTTTKETKETNLKNKDLKEEDKTKLQEEINSLTQKLQENKDKKESINKKTLDLIEQKKQLLTTKNNNQEKIKTITSQITKTSKNLFINEKLQILEEAMVLNSANKNIIKDLMIQNKDNVEEFQNLKSYDLFLDGQLIQFDKQIKQLQEEIKALQNNTSYQGEKKKVMFSDVYGMKQEKEELEDLIEYFKDDNTSMVNFDKLIPRGYLLYGPPGTGKSFLIKALCNELGIHYIELEPSRFDKTYVGEGNEELEKIWQEAENHDKTIIFIDEISGLANRADNQSNKTSINIINNLLTKLDGFKRSNKKIVLMGATNHLDKIDSALRSRFSKEIKIDLLKDDEIEGFLQFLVADYQISYHTYLHLKEIANRCKGKSYSTRNLKEKIIDSAYIKAKKYKRKNPNHEVMLASDLDEAINTFQNIKVSETTKEARRKECEDQYVEWKKGLLKYLKPPKSNIQINIKYTFYGLDGLGKGQHQEYEPTDIPPFYKNPFNKWKYKNSQIDHFGAFWNEHKRGDSQFKVSLRPSPTNHTIELNYEGPKWLLEEDKDFYIDEFECREFESIENFKDGFKYKNYYLHFNPVKQYITLYTKKFNTKNDENK